MTDDLRTLEARAVALATFNVAFQQLVEERTGIVMSYEEQEPILNELVTLYLGGNMDDLLDVAYARISSLLEAPR